MELDHRQISMGGLVMEVLNKIAGQHHHHGRLLGDRWVHHYREHSMAAGRDQHHLLVACTTLQQPSVV
jgi:hypothetical protein